MIGEIGVHGRENWPICGLCCTASPRPIRDNKKNLTWVDSFCHTAYGSYYCSISPRVWDYCTYLDQVRVPPGKLGFDRSETREPGKYTRYGVVNTPILTLSARLGLGQLHMQSSSKGLGEQDEKQANSANPLHTLLDEQINRNAPATVACRC